MHGENILREAGGDPNLPRVLLLAHTGSATDLIGKCFQKSSYFHIKHVNYISGGITIHSAFDFKFGHEITTSSDSKLADLRNNLAELSLIIIDEVSLVSADMLYKIDAKLKEIFPLRKHIPFAGIGVMLVGDLLQIPPVNSGYIFGRPTNDKSGVAYDITQFESEFIR